MWHPWKCEATRFTHIRPGEIRGSINKGDSLVFPGSPENLTIGGLHAWSNTNVRNIKHTKVDSCKCKGAPLPPQSPRHGTWGVWWARVPAWSATVRPGQVCCQDTAVRGHRAGCPAKRAGTTQKCYHKRESTNWHATARGPEWGQE